MHHYIQNKVAFLQVEGSLTFLGVYHNFVTFFLNKKNIWFNKDAENECTFSDLAKELSCERALQPHSLCS